MCTVPASGPAPACPEWEPAGRTSTMHLLFLLMRMHPSAGTPYMACRSSSLNRSPGAGTVTAVATPGSGAALGLRAVSQSAPTEHGGRPVL